MRSRVRPRFSSLRCICCSLLLSCLRAQYPGDAESPISCEAFASGGEGAMAAAAVILTGALDSLATRTAERASRSALLWLPPASYGALVVGAAAAVGYKWWTSSSRRLSARPDGFLATLLGAIAPSENSKAAQVRSLGCACTAGAAAASRDALRFVQVNLDPTSTPDTLEVRWRACSSRAAPNPIS